MSVVIRTDRLDLRSLDREAAAGILDGTPPPGVDWVRDYPFPESVDAARDVLSADPDHSRWTPFVAFQIMLRRTTQVIGDCGFEAPPDADGAVEVRYELAEAVRGRGFEREALEALVGFAFTRDEVTCVRASADAEDAHARRILEQAGMMGVGEYDGRLHFEA